MSLINKMLQDLDRRQALGANTNGAVVRQQPAAARGGREWFWRTLTVLLLTGVGGVIWAAFQLVPRPLVTEEAYLAAAQAGRRPAPLVVAPPPPVVAPAPVAAPPVTESLKLAQQLETPVQELAKAAPPVVRPAPTPKITAAPAKITAAPAIVPAAAKPLVEKRERTRTAHDVAESRFRRAVLFLKLGRVSEAEAELAGALQADASHLDARQAYVALLLEQGRIDPARHLLEQALSLDAAQPAFVLALARLHVERKDYAAALGVLEGAGASAGKAAFQALRAAVLQRLGRHGDAVAAYQDALRGDPHPATTWVGLGISLEALGRAPEAASAYRKALEAGPLAPEARRYAEARAAALD